MKLAEKHDIYRRTYISCVRRGVVLVRIITKITIPLKLDSRSKEKLELHFPVHINITIDKSIFPSADIQLNNTE
jgi:hypothetical protein